MKLPKVRNKYCPFCKKHTEHKIMQSKKRAPSSLKRGSKYRVKKREVGSGMGNLGRLSRPALTKWKRYGKKATKKTDLRYECKECKKSHVQKKGFRAKRLEFA